MTEPLVEVRNLGVRFGDGARSTVAVDGISFEIRRGECLALVGESGSGKSVTCRSLIGLAGLGSRVQVDRMHFDGTDLMRQRERDWRRLRGRRIGFVMQDALSSLDSLRPVGHEISEALRLHLSLTRRQAHARVLELLTAVGVPEPGFRATQYPYELSGGLRQRALIASAIACDPDLLIADEPTTALDATVGAQVIELLASLKTDRTALLIVRHNLAVVASLADRVAVMRDGVIVEEGPTEQVLHRPTHAFTRALLAAVPNQASRGTRLSGPGLGPTPPAPERPRVEAGVPPRVRAKNLTKSFKGQDGVVRTVVSDVSFELLGGETLGIVGESGSGKTTTARIVLGLEAPDAGGVELNGRDWTALSAVQRRAERRLIQVVYQDPLSSFDPRYTVDRVIGEALGAAGYRGRDREDRLRELLQLVSLDDNLRDRRPIELSGGQRQRVALARALAPNPDVIVCDEPVSALDVSVQARILDLLIDLQDRLGLSYLFISHDLGVIHHVSDRVLVMKGGVVLESGPVEKVFADPREDYTRALLAAIPRLATSA